MISGIPACPNHWVPRDATECRHLPCNVSMETLRSQKTKLVWCRWFSAWIGIPLENILKTSTTLHLHQVSVMHLSPVYEWGYESSGMSWDLSHIRICHKRSCISWSTGQPKHGWCWEMPGIRRWHEQSQWILGPLHKLLIVPRPEDIDGPIASWCVDASNGWRFSDAQRTSWSAMSSGNCAIGNHEAYHLQHVCSHSAGNLPAHENTTLSEDPEIQRLKVSKLDTF